MIPEVVLWLFPALFVLHDTEEAVLLISWLRRNRERMKTRFPTLPHRLYAHFEKLSHKAFATMAAEEFFVILAVTLYASLTGDCHPWLALLLAFGLHLFVHVAQAAILRAYIPSLATSLLCLPVVGWMLGEIENSRLFTVREFVLLGVAGVAVAAVNLFAIHLAAAKLSRG